MRILAVSDTHGRLGRLERLAETFPSPDYVFFLGDAEGQEMLIRGLFRCPVLLVKGNNDYFSREEREMLFDINGKNYYLTHGDRQGVSFGLDILLRDGIRKNAQVICFGHTHRPMAEKRNGIWLINPGSLTHPRQEDRCPSYAVIEEDGLGRIRAAVLRMEDYGND